MESARLDCLVKTVTTRLTRRSVLGFLSAIGAADMAHIAQPVVAKKRKHKKKKHKKKCQPCQEPDTCPHRVCCECSAQSPTPGCHIVGLDSNPSPSEVIAACDEACGEPGAWSGGNTSYTAGGITVACDTDNLCARVLCPI